MPEKGFGQKKKECKGGKKSKQRLTIAFIVNAAGGKEVPVVIWKSEKPRCFRGINKSQLPVQYFHQSKAWMTGDILHQVLSKINRQLAAKSRSVTLLMDNAGCHPHDMADRYSNIKIIWLPANTTSKLQPLDLGIIKTFKAHYRKFLLRYVLSKIDECQTGSEVANSVNVLTAIRWISLAWDQIQEETIRKCFKKAGILSEDGAVVSRLEFEEDPFGDLELEGVDDLSCLVDQIEGEHCSVDEGDNDLGFCFDVENENWDDEFFTNLVSAQVCNHETEELESDDEEECDVLPPEPKLKSI